jgi:C4-dicarboxylate-specific signal transduction histidine kinase
MLQKPMLQKSTFQKSPPAAAAEAQVLPAERALPAEQVLPAEKALLAEKVFLAQRMEIVGRLTGGIAHDLNNVLTVITGTIGILAEAVADRPDLAAITGLIDQAAARGADLTAYLIAFTRGQSSQPAEVDVNALLVDAARLLRPTLGELIEIETVLASDVAPALIDPKRLMIAVLNLAIVMRDAMAEGDRLTFETANGELSAGDQIMVAVRASDPGASAGHSARSLPDLGVTEDLVRSANGRVEIDGEAGHGTSVKIYLPQARGTP